MILLTESAAFDPLIVRKITERIESGRNVMITSGLLKALQGKGIEDIAEIKYTDRKALVKEFKAGWGKMVSSSQEILIPQITYLTNDSWEEVSAVRGATGWPLLHRAQYSKAYLYVLTIPDNISDLYQYPPEVLNRIRSVASKGMNIRLEGPSMVSLFCYDNGTFILNSFLDKEVTLRVVIVQRQNTGDRWSEKPYQKASPVCSFRTDQRKLNTFEVTVIRNPTEYSG
jgi:hypothetical protein